MLKLFLEAKGYPLPQHSPTKSPSALSRFLNLYNWPTRKIIRTTRKQILQEILSFCPKGRRPQLQVISHLAPGNLNVIPFVLKRGETLICRGLKRRSLVEFPESNKRGITSRKY